MSNVVRCDILQSEDGQWYYNAVAGNNKVVVTSELYTRKFDAIQAAKATFPDAEIPEEDEDE